MKRMLFLWSVLIGIVIAIGFLHPTWSFAMNPWTINALILFTLLFFIEHGLIIYRSLKAGFEKTLEHEKSHFANAGQEDHYISHNTNEG